MAASTVEVLLRFTGDPRNAKDAIAQVRADLTKSAQDQVNSARNVNKQVATEAKNQTKTLEREERQRTRASESLQRQRSAALIAEWKRQEREAARSAKQIADTQIRESKRSADAQLREAKRWAGVTQPSGGGSSIIAGAAGGVAALLGVSAISSIRQAGSAWFEYSSKLESTTIAFTTMLGSAQAASAHLKELQQFALTTPFEFSDLIGASQRMQALGFEAKQVVPVLTDVGNAVAAAGGGGERLDRVVLALSQMQSKGKVATQEMNQLAEAGLPGWKILEQQLGKSRAELVKLVEAGKISSQVFLDAFQQFSRNNFGGLMEKQSKTAIGALSNIKDAVLQLSNNAFEPLFRMVSNGLNSIAKDLQTNQSSWEAWGKGITSSIASTVSGLALVLGQLRSLDREIGQLLRLPELQKAIKEAGERQEQSKTNQLVIAAALLNQLRGATGTRAPGTVQPEGEFAIPGVVLNERGEPVDRPAAAITKPTIEETEKKKAKGTDPAATAKRIAELALANTIAGFNAEEEALKRSLARREKSFEEFAAELTLLESARHVRVVAGLKAEGEAAAQLRSEHARTIALKQIDGRLDQENTRNKNVLNAIEDRRFEITDQINDAIERQQKQLSELVVKTGDFTLSVEDLIDGLADQGVALSKTDEFWLRFNARIGDSITRMRTMLELMRQTSDAVPSPATGKITEAPAPRVDVGLPPPEEFRAVVDLATQAGGVFAGLGTILSDTFNLGASGAVAFADTLSSAFGQVASAVGDAVHAFVLFGTVEGGFRKFAAEVIASLAAQATVQALYQFAQGLAWLALNFFFPNPKYAMAATTAFASAAAFGAIAGVTVPLGRAIAGNSFSQAGAGGGGGSSTTSGGGTPITTQPKTQEFDRNARNQQAITVNLNIRRDAGSIVEAVVLDGQTGGLIRKLIQSEIAS